jgi:arabinogalactan endo-1,4-beta-galactosidase
MRKLLLLLLFTVVTTMASAQKYVGGDISMLKKFLDEGAIYNDKDGNVVQPLAFFKEQGWNAMRVRLFVDPANASSSDRKEGAIQDLEYVKAMGKDIKAAGLKFMLDFHYSDTWTDPGQHSTPASFRVLPALYEELLYSYTKQCLKELNEVGATPDFIQTGNEITYGMLWPTGHIWPAGGGQDGGTWENFTRYLTEAIRACKEMCPDAQIVIHTEMSKAQNVIDFYQQLSNYPNVSYDIIGLSYYPDFHNGLNVLNSTLTTLESSYPNKNIMIVETGYGFEWPISGAKYDFSDIWPITEEGQRKYTADLIATLNSHPHVNGLFWWYPEYTLNNIVFKNGTEDWSKDFTSGYWNAALFHYKTGKALAAFYELKNFNDGSAGMQIVRSTDNKDGAWYTLDGRKLNETPQKKGIYINNNKKVIVR